MSDFDCDPLFSRIYLEMLEQMTAYSARRLGDIGLAEDVAQDTFAECWKNWEQGQRVKHHPNPRGWLWEALKIKLKKMREDMEKVRTVPPEEPAAQAAVSRPAGLRRFRHFPRTLIAAAVVAVLFGLGSMAGSSRLWESVVHLTQGTLQIVPPGASQSGQTSAQPPLEELEFTSLQEALDAYGITEPLAPKWVPEGFETERIDIDVDPDFIRIMAVYQCEEKAVQVTVRNYNSKEELDRISVEKENGQQDVKYIRGGVEHSLAQNRAIYTASWTNGLNIVSIIGDVTEEELEQMIDSIYT